MDQPGDCFGVENTLNNNVLFASMSVCYRCASYVGLMIWSS